VSRPPPSLLFVVTQVSPVHAAASFVTGAVGRTITGVAIYAATSGNNNNPNILKSSSNPSVHLSSMIGNLASSVFGGKNSMLMMKKNPKFDQQLETLNVPSWDKIRTLLEEQQTPEERLFRTNLPNGYGVGSPFHKVRLYNEQNKVEDVRVVFYRDSASWCPYCQKVWITLEEKQIPYRTEKINMRCYGEKPPSFQQLQPSGQIPVAIIDNVTYRQSNDILSVLEQSFPNHKPLIPTQPNVEAKIPSLLRLERELFSAWMYWLTSSSNAKDSFIQVLQRVEQALQTSEGPFFLGNEVSIVDIQFAPFLERIVASMMYYKGYQIRFAPPYAAKTNHDYPAINAWFDAMERLPSYQLTKGDYYSHCWDLPPQLGGCIMEPNGRKYAAVINGEKRMGTDDDNSSSDVLGSWELPLQLHNGGIEPDWLWVDVNTSRREAVERVSFNYDAIIKFASRGAGTKGYPPVSAPLADPNAVPNESVQTSVGIILRLICLSIIDGTTEKYDTTMDTIGQMAMENSDDEYVTGIIDSLVYLRDRVGVPRDMQLGAARQLRAHLNWAIKRMLVAQDAKQQQSVA
jgi:glutathione S-transferase